MYTALLAAHIAGAGYLGIILAQASIALARKKTDLYASYARRIAAMLVVQVVSGCLLVLESNQPVSALAFCGKFSLYVIPTLGIEGLLFFHMLPNPLERFPASFVASAFCLSAFIAVGTLLAPM